MTARVRPIRILVVLALINLVAYAARNALFAVYPTLAARYHIGNAELGFLQTVFMLPHAAATLGFGWAGDRFDRRRVIAFGMALASIAAVLGVVGESYVGLAVSRGLVGFGTAAVVPVANSILGQVFEGPKKASRIAVFNLGLFVGGVLGFLGGTLLGFPLVVIALAVPGIGLGMAFVVVAIPRHAAVPPNAIVVTSGEGGRQTSLLITLATFVGDARELLRIPTLRWVIASTTVMAFAAGGYNAWLQVFLVTEKGMSPADATSLLALALCGGLSGILVGARISDRLSTKSAAGRLWTIVFGMILTAPCASAAILLPAGIALQAIGVLTLFFISWYHAPMAATVDDLAPPRLAAAAQGLVIFTMHMLGTAPSSWILGAISEKSSIGTALWVPTVGLVVAAGCMVMATRTFAADRTRARGAL